MPPVGPKELLSQKRAIKLVCCSLIIKKVGRRSWRLQFPVIPWICYTDHLHTKKEQSPNFWRHGLRHVPRPIIQLLSRIPSLSLNCSYTSPIYLNIWDPISGKKLSFYLQQQWNLGLLSICLPQPWPSTSLLKPLQMVHPTLFLSTKTAWSMQGGSTQESWAHQYLKLKRGATETRLVYLTI